MKKIEVTIAGAHYTLMTDNEPEYAESVAEQADSLISEIMEKGVSPSQATVLALLEYADNAAKLSAEVESLKSQMKEYLADAAQAKAERDLLKRELAKAKKGAEN